MSLPVLTAITDPRHEADLAARVHASSAPVTVVRRCVDIADLLAAAAAGLARAAVVSPDFRRFDQAAVDRLGHSRVAVVGFAASPDAARRLDQLGVGHSISPAASAADLVAAAGRAIGDLDRDPSLQRILDWSGPPPSGAQSPTEPAPRPVGPGQVIAVWGPAGAPGRTSIAINVAAELAADQDVLVVDADCYGGVIGQALGLLDEAATLATACRAADAGRLDDDALSLLAVPVAPRLRVLTGIGRADRWPELRPGALDRVLTIARDISDFVVVDTGFCLEQDEELAYDTAAPRRNGSTLAALRAADAVIAIAAGDPLGLTRYVRAHGELTALLPGSDITTVVNRLRKKVVGAGDPISQIAQALARHAGVSSILAVPDDPAAFDAAVAVGRTLSEVAPRSPARIAIRRLARQLAGLPPGKDRRPRRRPSGSAGASVSE